MFHLHATGDWSPEKVHTSHVSSGRLIVPEVEELIARAWSDATRVKGRVLFDGPMCRLESFTASPEQLQLRLSRTSYKAFLGTNLSNPHLADRHGLEILANPVGVSVGLVTCDGWMLLGVRNDRVAYYPCRIHPFAGSLEPGEDANVFAAVYRELAEELSLDRRQVVALRCVGLAADHSIRQPELIFQAYCELTRDQILAQLDPGEHTALHAIRADADAIDRACPDERLTPVAVATLILHTTGVDRARLLDKVGASHDLPVSA